MRQRAPRKHDEAHLSFIRSLPCVVCLNNIETEAAHVRLTSAMAAKTNSGVGAKPDDRWAVPLCSADHRKQHSGSEKQFWKSAGIDPLYLALALQSVSGDYDAGTMVVTAHHFHGQPQNLLAAG